jgi:diguanylate cyclase (GGDEF)-like protein
MEVTQVPALPPVAPLSRRHRLGFRIVALFLGLLLIIQFISFHLVERSIDENARKALYESLDLGERVLDRLLLQNATHLYESTRLLSADYGFREAIASDDRETLVSALDNHGERLGAAFAVFTNAQGALQASTLEGGPSLQPLVSRAIGSATPDGDVAVRGIVGQLQQRPYQLVAVPVKAPLTIGWVVMGFKLDQALLRDIKQLTGLDLVILTRSDQGPWQAALSQMRPDQTLALTNNWMPSLDLSVASRPAQLGFDLPGGLHVARMRSLNAQPGERTLAMMLRSVDEAVAPYKELQLSIMVLNVVGVLAFAMGSVFTARRITTPVVTLTKLARRLSGGDFSAPIPSHGQDEIGELADAFEAMRRAVREREEAIIKGGFIDALTGLPNRAQFTMDVKAATAHALGRSNGSCAVIMLDLDRFKHVNNVLGHDAGDQLLQRVGRLLRDVIVDQHNTVARLSGDEFAVLLRQGDVTQARAVARSIQQHLETTIDLNGNTVDLGAGIGIATCPEHAQDANTLLRQTELAMYKAKQSQVGHVVFRPELDAKSDEALSLLGELRQALERNELRLHLQPKVSLASGEVIGAEALVRWQHPTRGLVPPGLFIPFAEQSGFIRHLTTWLLEESMRTWRNWSERGLTLQMSINLSARDLIDPELPGRVTALLAQHGVPPHCLCLEITESAIMDDPNRAQQTLEQFHYMGVLLSIDDFGTGYSSLAYLKKLPVNELKIDKSFVMNMQRDVQDAKIVRSVVDLAHNLGLKVTAEGLEEEAAWSMLKALGCDIAQGYWIAKPMPSEQFPEWVSRWTPPVSQSIAEKAQFA